MTSSLKLKIQSIEPAGRSFRFEKKPELFPAISEVVNAGECRFTAPIRIEGRAHRVKDLIEIDGFVETQIHLSCSRCLNGFEMPLADSFSLTFRQQAPAAEPAAEPAEKELTADDFGLIPFRGEEIDLHDSIQEQIVVMLPQKPLCSESCKGLCPQCGADLNQADCGCRQPLLDDRFAVLKNFKPRTDED